MLISPRVHFKTKGKGVFNLFLKKFGSRLAAHFFLLPEGKNDTDSEKLKFPFLSLVQLITIGKSGLKMLLNSI